MIEIRLTASGLDAEVQRTLWTCFDRGQRKIDTDTVSTEKEGEREPLDFGRTARRGLNALQGRTELSLVS